MSRIPQRSAPSTGIDGRAGWARVRPLRGGGSGPWCVSGRQVGPQERSCETCGGRGGRPRAGWARRRPWEGSSCCRVPRSGSRSIWGRARSAGRWWPVRAGVFGPAAGPGGAGPAGRGGVFPPQLGLGAVQLAVHDQPAVDVAVAASGVAGARVGLGVRMGTRWPSMVGITGPGG